MNVEDIVTNIINFVDYHDRPQLREVGSIWRNKVDSALIEINNISDLDIADDYPHAELILTNLNSTLYDEYQLRAIQIQTDKPELLLPELPRLRTLIITRGQVASLNYDLEICRISNARVQTVAISAIDVTLTNCALTQLPILNCDYLNCSNNRVTSIDNLLLKYLNCSNNRVTSVNLPELIKLDISNNPTKTIQAGKLTYLNCDNCQVREFDTPNLVTLSCRGNKFTHFEPSDNLTQLDCRNNLINIFDARNLRELRIDNNPLETLNLRRLKALTCRNTNLTSLPDSEHLELLICDCEIGFYPNLVKLSIPKWRVEQARELYRSHDAEELLDTAYTRSSFELRSNEG